MAESIPLGVYEFGRGESDELLCPIPSCDRPLFLSISEMVSLEWPVDSITTATTLAGYLNTAGGAVSKTWEVMCDDGHVICTPSGADDYADFDYVRFLSGKPADSPGEGESRCKWCGVIVEGDDEMCAAEDCADRERQRGDR